MKSQLLATFTTKDNLDDTIKKIINKLKTYAKQGIDKFAQALGIEIDGSAKFKVNF